MLGSLPYSQKSSIVSLELFGLIFKNGSAVSNHVILSEHRLTLQVQIGNWLSCLMHLRDSSFLVMSKKLFLFSLPSFEEVCGILVGICASTTFSLLVSLGISGLDRLRSLNSHKCKKTEKGWGKERK